MVDLNTLDSRGIYQDLLNELILNGNKLYIASPAERRTGEKTRLIKGDGYEILKIRTLNLQKTNVVEKGLGQLLMESQFEKAIKRHWENIKFDLILYSTPPITFNKIIESIKRRDGARTYLLLKDIFPQNAVDLQMMKKDGFLHKMFRKKEKKLYEISDSIGCMSPANKEFLIKNNPGIDGNKIEICPNSIKIEDNIPISKEEKEKILTENKIPDNKTVFIYGGNLGKPQGIDFLIDVLKENEKEDKSFIIIIGSGTEYPKIKNWFDLNNPKNSLLLSALAKAEYDKVVKVADVGLIFLDHRFTIPNFPSRLLSYLENSQPVLCATDKNTDIGTIAMKEGFGLWCESTDLGTFMSYINKLSKRELLRKEMGEKGRKFLEKEYDIKDAAKKILR